MEKEEKSWLFLNGFWLKIIALLCMTLDHLGLMINMYYLPDSDPLIIVLRSIGRLALPLFCFMICEGCLHTKHKGKYAIKLGIMAVLISISIVVLGEGRIIPSIPKTDIRMFGNIFIDLLLGASAIFCLQSKKIGLKFLALLPIAYSVVSYIVYGYEWTTGTLIHWFPYFLRTQYGWFGVALIIVFYLSYYLKDLYLTIHEENTGIPASSLDGTIFSRIPVNIISAILLVGVSLVYSLSTSALHYMMIPQQAFASLAAILIIFYNGTRGYNKKWFQYGCYVYYPLHILILAFIFFLITK